MVTTSIVTYNGEVDSQSIMSLAFDHIDNGIEYYYKEFNRCDDNDQLGRRKYYEKLVACAFYGAKWPADEHYSLLGFLTAYNRDFLGVDLWSVWRLLEHGKVVLNDDTKSLASAMAHGYANTLRATFHPAAESADIFISTFQEHGEQLLSLMKRGKIFIEEDGYLWLKKISQPGDIKIFTPRTWDNLIAVTQVMGDDLLTCRINYRFLSNSDLRSPLKLNYGEFDKWISVIPHNVLEGREKLFCAEFAERKIYYDYLLSSKQGGETYRKKVIKNIAQSLTDKFTPGVKQIRLGVSFTIEKSIQGILLCKMLHVLNHLVENVESIRGLPSEDEYKVRALTVLLSNKKDWYDNGKHALTMLQQRLIAAESWRRVNKVNTLM